MPEFVLLYEQLPCWMYLCSESPVLASCCRGTADQRGWLRRLHTPPCWIFFVISLLLQTSWQEVNGLLAQQSLLPRQGGAAWPDVRHPLFERARGDGAAGRAPLLTFAVVRAQAAPTERKIAVLLRLHIPLAKLHFFLLKKGLKAKRDCQKYLM